MIQTEEIKAEKTADLERLMLLPAVQYLNKLKGFSMQEKSDMLFEVLRGNAELIELQGAYWLEEAIYHNC